MQFRSVQLLLLLFKTNSGFKGLKQQFKRKESHYSLSCSLLFSLLVHVFDLLDQRQFQFLIDYISGINPINSQSQALAGGTTAENMFLNQSGAQGGKEGRSGSISFVHPTSSH